MREVDLAITKHDGRWGTEGGGGRQRAVDGR